VAECAVVGVPHPDFGEGVLAVVARSRVPRWTSAGWWPALAGELAKYKLPKRIFVADALPAQRDGQGQKNELRERYKATFARPVA
jgi:malonyl-CoA/methylmalonyl-CoA synthetase